MATNYNITLKRNNGTDYDILYPKTLPEQVVGLITDGKITVGLLPNSVFDSLYYFTTIGTATNLSALASAAYLDTGKPYEKGYYWVMTAQAVLTANAAAVLVGSYYYVTSFVATEGGGTPATVTLEAGDWIILDSFSTAAGTVGDPFVVKFATVNNTYELATTSADGIVRLSSSTSVATTGDAVITNGILNGLMGTSSTTIAYGNHTHTGVYEPHTTGLTDLAAVLTAGGTGFIKLNGANDAILDTNSYLNASTTSVQDGYFGDIYLKDDGTPSHYLQVTASSNLTANRLLSIATGDANRTITLGGDFTTATGNVSITAASGGSALTLPTALTISAVPLNGIAYGSSANNLGYISSTSIGRASLTIPDIAAISFARYNADETISMLDAASFRTAIGAGTSSATGTVTSVATTGAISGGTITTTGTISHLDTDGYKHVPTTSTTNDRKFLVAGATAGTFAWESWPRILWDTTTGSISGDIIFDNDAT